MIDRKNLSRWWPTVYSNFISQFRSSMWPSSCHKFAIQTCLGIPLPSNFVTRPSHLNLLLFNSGHHKRKLNTLQNHRVGELMLSPGCSIIWIAAKIDIIKFFPDALHMMSTFQISIKRVQSTQVWKTRAFVSSVNFLMFHAIFLRSPKVVHAIPIDVLLPSSTEKVNVPVDPNWLSL